MLSKLNEPFLGVLMPQLFIKTHVSQTTAPPRMFHVSIASKIQTRRRSNVARNRVLAMRPCGHGVSLSGSRAPSLGRKFRGCGIMVPVRTATFPSSTVHGMSRGLNSSADPLKQGRYGGLVVCGIQTQSTDAPAFRLIGFDIGRSMGRIFPHYTDMSHRNASNSSP